MSLNTLLRISPCPNSKLIKQSDFSSTCLIEPPTENKYTGFGLGTLWQLHFSLWFDKLTPNCNLATYATCLQG